MTFTAGDIIRHGDMCSVEGSMLQRGMNFGDSTKNTVILMSRRHGAPYEDVLSPDGRILIYEGHDVERRGAIRDPKRYDQPREYRPGVLTQNGKFEHAALSFKAGKRSAEPVRVYEKVKDGIWTYNGTFLLTDAWQAKKGRRTVFLFKLELADESEPRRAHPREELKHERVIPSNVKQEVWKRDGGRCVICKRTDNLHFDHDLPFSKGGTSILAANIRLLCARHNLAKSAKIE